MVRQVFFIMASAMVLSCQGPQAKKQSNAKAPNVLFIAIDDLNDWVGYLKGHPQAKTPNIDRLAMSGMAFTNAHAQAPICNPSRTSILTGLRPSNTGIYGLSPWFREIDSLKALTSLPQHFSDYGYKTFSGGKIYHGGYGLQPNDTEFDSLGPGSWVRQWPKAKLIGETPGGNHKLMDWGVFEHEDKDKSDYKVADWAVEVLQAEHDTPFFLAAGFFLPHVPIYVTEKWWDSYPEESLQMPLIKEKDREDTPRFSWYLHWDVPEPRLQWLRETENEVNLVRSYLAAISFVDAQVGRLLDALEASGKKENTLIVLWSDHGYHLGEKEISGKNSLWEPSTRVPLIFSGPGIPAGQQSGEAVELLDIFPTLSDWAGLPGLAHLEGHSLMPLFKDPSMKREFPAITTQNWRNHSIRTEKWRYIRYSDGSQELYDMQKDPEEWDNLAADSRYQGTMDSLAQWIPKKNRLPIIIKPWKILESHDGKVIWEGKEIKKDDPIPGYEE